MILQNQKHLFNLTEDVTYLNIAALSPSFQTIEEAGIKAVKKKSQPHQIPISDFFEPVVELKKLFAKLIDVDDHNRIANIPSVSYGLSTVANNIKLNQGDEILVLEGQFPSNYYVWESLAKQYNAKVKVVQAPVTKHDQGLLWNQAILDAITDHTAVIAISNIHWSNGTIFNLKDISKKAKLHQALLIIDGSQSIGALPFSTNEIQPDAVICAGYKWLFGPYGCGYAYFGAYFDNGIPIEENWSNRLGSENFAGLTNYESEYKPLANRYSVGEHGSFIYVQMQIAALKQILAWTPKAIQNYCQHITQDAVISLKALGCEIEDASHRAHHLFGIKLPESINLDALKKTLKDQSIFVSYRGQFVRVSCHLYNTKEDFTKLINAITTMIETD